jgi:hypothetical protein
MAPKTAHLAPDFDKRVNFNTMRVKPEYRIELKMGNIEDLFANAPDTVEGRMERLQVLGLFYFPLKHKRAKDRFPESWKWFKDKIAKVADDAAADKIIQSALKSRVVSGAVPPAWDAAATGLPVDAADPLNPAAENFAKIRIPGCFTVQYGAGSGSVNEDSAYPGKFHDHKLYPHETKFYDDNKVLGKIPLVAKVEKRLTEDDPWEPAKDASVHFQLLPAYPDDKPAFDPGVKSSEQFMRPPLSALRAVPASPAPPNPPFPLSNAPGGPKKKIDALVAANATGDSSITGADVYKDENLHKVDPQGRNAHHSKGGKRGHGSLTSNSDVAGHLFSTTSMDGFNADGPRKPAHKPYPVAEKAKAKAHKHVHAVRAKTNEDGEAGVIFMPSRCGGDRYRLRAYIGPPTSASHGGEVGATQVTTGTLVVWRNYRVSRFITQQAGAAPHNTLVTEAGTAPYTVANGNAYLQLVSAHDGTSHVGMGTVRLDDPDGGGASPFTSLPLHYAPAYLEVEFDQAQENLTDAEYKAARKQGLADAKTGMAAVGLTLDLEKLYFDDVDFKADETCASIVMRTPESYNAVAPVGKRLRFSGGTIRQSVQDKVVDLTENYAINGFMRTLTKDGALPGITLIYTPMGYTWQLVLGLDYSGRVQDYRGSYLWYGAATYTNLWTVNPGAFPYDCTSNACHEMGHGMFQAHGVGGSAGGPISGRHDRESQSMCVMSYADSNGQYCGLTLLSFQGWDVP